MNTEAPPKPKFPHATALALADRIVAELSPLCERIQIAGSLRRLRPTVSDIEILYVPRFDERQVDMFATEPFDLANEKIGEWLANGEISKRPKIDGSFTWGLKNKLALHRDGIPIDFFATDAACWYVALVIRTGGKATNLKLTTGAIARKRKLNAYGSGFTTFMGEKIVCTSEEDVFGYAGVPFAPPEARE